ncbi:hypothetical protein MRB53_010872 [Persea americana]|uniref:Uncharacterized protein n=1 Tax=Persea americana TaxID=3435 RepID=A0ACC2LTC3_PERAE|nr:hypothetical protein MRB53_010872 [Persea americana]
MDLSQSHLNKSLVQMENQSPIWHTMSGLNVIMLLSWINATLLDSALPYIFRMNTAKEAWDSLEIRYASLSRSHVIELKKRLQHVKKGSSTIQDYLRQVKVLSDQLATYGAPVIEDDLIIHTLAGPPPIYHPFQTSIQTHSRHDHVSLEE